MQHKFIQTTNYINCLEAMKELARLPRDMEKMGLFYGNAGRGKSLIIEKLAIDEGACTCTNTWKLDTKTNDDGYL
ncbi:hypothetical protein V7P26_09055 [Arcobacter cryaerophilus gv. pseudocryaerophilus]